MSARRRIATALAALTLVVASASACKKPEEPLHLRKVLIDVAPGSEGPGGVLERDAVRRLVERRIEDDKRVDRTDSRDASVLRVRLESAAVTSSADGPGGTLSVTLEVTGGAPGQLHRSRYRGNAVASLKGARGSGEGGIDFSALFLQAYNQALEQVLDARGAQELESRKLIAWVADDKLPDEQRRQAIRILGARKEPQAVPALMHVLDGDDRSLSQAALGALTLIGDPSALEAVIEYADGKPSLVRKQAIEAASQMGGKLAKAWLFTMSTGHTDADVRAAAARALGGLEADDADAPRVAESVVQNGEPDEATP